MPLKSLTERRMSRACVACLRWSYRSKIEEVSEKGEGPPGRAFRRSRVAAGCALTTARSRRLAGGVELGYVARSVHAPIAEEHS